MKQDDSPDNNTILLFDSSMNLRDVFPIIKEKNPKIITFDYNSHKLFEEKNIQHEISDNYISSDDLDYIQKKSYYFAYWFDKPEISDFVQYDEINIGESFYHDFHYNLVSFLKKFIEIKKLFESNKNSTYISSSLLCEIISSFTTSIIKLKINDIILKNINNSTEISLKIGKLPIKITNNRFQKLKNIFEKLFLYFLPRNSKLQKNNLILFIDFTTKKYRQIFNILSKFPVNIVKFYRIIPTVWNLESYSIIKRSRCLVENYASLFDNSMKNSINSGILDLKSKTDLL